MLSIVSELLPIIKPLLERLIPDPAERAAVEQQIAAQAQEAQARMIEAQRDVVVAESGGGWLQRNWRPIFMFVCMGLLLWHAMALPVMAALLSVPLSDMIGLEHVPDGLWTLLTIGMGGYIGGRTIEKVAKARGGLF